MSININIEFDKFYEQMEKLDTSNFDRLDYLIEITRLSKMLNDLFGMLVKICQTPQLVGKILEEEYNIIFDFTKEVSIDFLKMLETLKTILEDEKIEKKEQKVTRITPDYSNIFKKNPNYVS